MKTYEASHYLEILEDRIGAAPKRGYRGDLAAAMKVHSSYLTRIMAGNAHLTPDQAADLAAYWKLGEAETRAFILLVMRDRAGSPALKRSLDAQLAEIRATENRLSTQISAKRSSQEDHALYYSSWHYPAIHVLLLVPANRTPEKLATLLQLPKAQILTSLAELEKIGLAKRAPGGEWTPIVRDLHLADQTLWTPIIHASWRQKATLRIGERRDEEFHYSGIHTCTKDDAERIRKLWRETLLECRKIASDSPRDETHFVLLFDLFGL
jgi:hypothetical protein